MTRRPEDVASLVLLAGAVAWVILDLGSPVVSFVAFAVVALLQIPGQRAHGAARSEAIAEFRDTRDEFGSDERANRLATIERVYGRNHPAVRRLVAEERAPRGDRP